MVIFHCTSCSARLQHDGYDAYTCARCHKVQSRGILKRSFVRRFHADMTAEDETSPAPCPIEFTNVIEVNR